MTMLVRYNAFLLSKAGLRACLWNARSSVVRQSMLRDPDPRAERERVWGQALEPRAAPR
jgi:hypothetical protein